MSPTNFVKLFAASMNFIKVACKSHKLCEVVGKFYKLCKVVGSFYQHCKWLVLPRALSTSDFHDKLTCLENLYITTNLLSGHYLQPPVYNNQVLVVLKVAVINRFDCIYLDKGLSSFLTTVDI